MALRKPLFMTSDGYAEEMAAADSLALGGLTMSGAIAMGSNKITGIAQGSGSGDALAWGQDASVANLTVTGALAAAMSAGSFKITNLAQASASADALGWGQNASVANFAVTGALTANMAAGANKITGLGQASATGDALGWGQNASIANLTVTGALGGALAAGGFAITNLADPSSAQDAATKAYVDAVKTGLDFKDSVRVIATSNITLSGTQTIDGVAVVAGDRVLVAGQTAAKDNGIYVVAAGAWSRASDADNTPGVEFGPGAFAFVEEGTLYKDTGWVMTADAPFTLGTSSCSWVQFSAAGVILAGAGLSKTGNTLAVRDGDGIFIDGSNNVSVDLATNPGLQFSSGKLAVKPDAAQGIQVSASGVGVNVSLTGGLEVVGTALGIKVDAGGYGGVSTSSSGLLVDPAAWAQGPNISYDPFMPGFVIATDSTLDAATGPLAVKGLPLSFEINGTAVDSKATAGNISKLVNGTTDPDLDTLHRHDSVSLQPATWSGSIAAGDPIFISANNTGQKADAADDQKRNIIGVAGMSADAYRVVNAGRCRGILTNAVANTKYYLAAGGGLTTTLPAAGNNIIQVGYALNATDLFVQIQDYGKRAA